MHIRTSSLKGPFHVISDDGCTLTTEQDIDCALAYVQGTLDRISGDITSEHVIEILYDRHVGHRANEFAVIHRGFAKYFVGKEFFFGAASVLKHCLDKSTYRSFVATIHVDDSHYTFSKNDERAKNIYHRQRFGCI